MARRRERPGMQPVGQLQQDVRTAFEPIVDLLARITGISGIAKLKIDEKFASDKVETTIQTVITAALGGAATLAQTITKVNELQAALEESRTIIAELQNIVTDLRAHSIATQRLLNDTINRLQED